MFVMRRKNMPGCDCCLLTCASFCSGEVSICEWEIDTPLGSFSVAFDATDVHWFSLSSPSSYSSEYSSHPLRLDTDWELCSIGRLPPIDPSGTYQTSFLETVTSPFSQVFASGSCTTSTYAGTITDRYLVQVQSIGVTGGFYVPLNSGPLIAVHRNIATSVFVVSFNPRVALVGQNNHTGRSMTINGVAFTGLISVADGAGQEARYSSWNLGDDITNCAGSYDDVLCSPDAPARLGIWNTGTRDYTFGGVLTCTGTRYNSLSPGLAVTVRTGNSIQFRGRFSEIVAPSILFRIATC